MEDSKHDVTCHTFVKMKVYITVFYSDNSVAVKVMRQNEMNLSCFL